MSCLVRVLEPAPTTDVINELGYADASGAQRIARHVAGIAVASRQFAETTLPLLLTMNTEHEQALQQLVISMKCELDEIGDSIRDIEHDLEELIELLTRPR